MPRDRETWKITVGDPEDALWCPNCGASDLTTAHVTGWPRVRHWLAGGGTGGGTSHLCSACGTGWSMGMFAGHEGRGPRWWSLPVRTIRGIGRARRMHPDLWVSMAALGLGLVAGIASGLAGGPPWWLFALAVPALTWLGFALALFSSQGTAADAWTEILEHIAPGRASRRRWRIFHERLRASAIPFYGLGPSWTGRRALDVLGPWAAPGYVELSHGDAELGRGRRWIVVGVDLRRVPEPFPHRGLIKKLWRSTRALPKGVHGQDFLRLVRMSERELAQRPLPEPRVVEIPIDGRPVRFELVAEGNEWIAWAQVSEAMLSLHARGVELAEIDLVTITDIEPYIAGSTSVG